jgi:hypothetical protein
MSTCEKCWRDAHCGSQFSVSDEYARLLKERAEHPCTPEEQAGEDARRCPACHRIALHQHTGECMACGCWPERIEEPEER